MIGTSATNDILFFMVNWLTATLLARFWISMNWVMLHNYKILVKKWSIFIDIHDLIFLHNTFFNILNLLNKWDFNFGEYFLVKNYDTKYWYIENVIETRKKEKSVGWWRSGSWDVFSERSLDSSLVGNWVQFRSFFLFFFFSFFFGTIFFFV